MSGNTEEFLKLEQQDAEDSVYVAKMFFWLFYCYFSLDEFLDKPSSASHVVNDKPLPATEIKLLSFDEMVCFLTKINLTIFL